MVIAGFSLMTMLLILLAGIGAGFVGYAVGASSLVSYPALLALGIPPVLANASNTVGVIGTGIGGVLGARKELRGQRLRSITYVSIGAVGGVAGAALLLSLDPKIFEFAVPPLILFSSLIIAVNPRGRMQARQAAADVMAQARSLTTPQGQGSDGAPAVLDAGKIGPFHQINALKTLIGTGANISASVIFIVRGVVDWPAAILLCIGCFIGGYIASPVTRRIPARIMRIAAVLAGIVLTVDLAMKTYL